MIHSEAKTLFQLQTDLTDAKVEIAMSKAISEIVQQIRDLRHEMHQEISSLKNEMGSRLAL